METLTKKQDLVQANVIDLNEPALARYKRMTVDFDYAQIIWTITRYHKEITNKKAAELLNAFLQWIAAAPQVEDGKLFVMLETPVEEAFHSFVLNTRLYDEFCYKFLGFFFHHNPLVSDGGSEVEDGVHYTVELLERTYGTGLHPLLQDWRRQLNEGTYKVACVKCIGPIAE